jgi:hypothetical protein
MTTAREESARLTDLLRCERHALAEFIVALATFDERRVWAELGHTSLFWFLHRELGLSKSAAFYRKTAAELVQRFPDVVAPLRDGRLCLSSVAELAKVITPENRAEIMPRFFTLSKAEAREIVAELLPADAPPLRDAVTVVAAPASDEALAFGSGDALLATSPSAPPSRGSPANLLRANSAAPDEASPRAPVSKPPAFDVEPLTADLRRLHITVSRRLLEKLDAAGAVLSHSHPVGSSWPRERSAAPTTSWSTTTTPCRSRSAARRPWRTRGSAAGPTRTSTRAGSTGTT